MSTGAWSNDLQTSLTLPTGATSGARIVLDGTTNLISIYNSAGVLVDTIGGPDGAIQIGNTSTGHFIFNPTDNTLNAYDSSGNLEAQWDVDNASFIFLDNTNLVFTRLGPANISFGQISSPGTLPSAQQLFDAGFLSSLGFHADLWSPKDSANASFDDGAKIVTISGASGATTGTTNPYVVITDTNMTSSEVDLYISGNVISNGETWFQPTYQANWYDGTSLNGLGGPPVQIRKMPDDTIWIYGLAYADVGAGQTLFFLPSGYYPLINGSVNVGVASDAPGGGGTDVAVNYAIDTSSGAFIVSNVLEGFTYALDVRVPLFNIA